MEPPKPIHEDDRRRHICRSSGLSGIERISCYEPQTVPSRLRTPTRGSACTGVAASVCIIPLCIRYVNRYGQPVINVTSDQAGVRASSLCGSWLWPRHRSYKEDGRGPGCRRSKTCCANGFANETVRDGGRRRRARATPISPAPWSRDERGRQRRGRRASYVS